MRRRQRGSGAAGQVDDGVEAVPAGAGVGEFGVDPVGGEHLGGRQRCREPGGQLLGTGCGEYGGQGGRRRAGARAGRGSTAGSTAAPGVASGAGSAVARLGLVVLVAVRTPSAAEGVASGTVRVASGTEGRQFGVGRGQPHPVAVEGVTGSAARAGRPPGCRAGQSTCCPPVQAVAYAVGSAGSGSPATGRRGSTTPVQLPAGVPPAANSSRRAHSSGRSWKSTASRWAIASRPVCKVQATCAGIAAVSSPARRWSASRRACAASRPASRAESTASWGTGRGVGDGTGAVADADVLLQDDVGVRAARAEGAHARRPRPDPAVRQDAAGPGRPLALDLERSP